MSRPGEVAGWPKLVVTYTTDPANIAPLLPPGIEPLDPTVTVGFYCVPVLRRPVLTSACTKDSEAFASPRPGGQMR